MAALITELIDKQDNFEIVRDKIAAILAIESSAQVALAIAASKPTPDDWKLRVYLERSNPWEAFLNDEPDRSPLVNVWFDTSTFDQSGSNIYERQKCEATFNIDCYGYGVASDNVGGGHNPGDLDAALVVQRAIRLVRNILMSAQYTRLDLPRDTIGVGLRWPQSLSIFQPELGNDSYQQVVGARGALSVGFNEFSPQYELEELEEIFVDIHRAEDGKLVAEADYIYPL